VAWLAALSATGWSARLAAWATTAGHGLPRLAQAALAVVIVIGVIALGWELVSFPFAFYRSYLLDRRYGLSSEPLSRWLADHCKALALGFVLFAAASLTIYGVIQLTPAIWWLVSAVLFGLAGLLLSCVAPFLLMPLFYRVRPLDREALRERLVVLSRRAGVPVLGAFEWGLGEKTRRANAALVGAGATRRILVSDTLLKDYSDDEIEVILAHEIAHHVHYDMWSALGVETLVAAVALYGAHATLAWAAQAPGDPAALPLLALAAIVVSLVLSPLGNAWSRHNERRADRFALALTRRPSAFITAMRRLGAQNLAEQAPSRPVVWFFHTHPTIDERIAAAVHSQDAMARAISSPSFESLENQQ
jgi:STE24 endopeptidase